MRKIYLFMGMFLAMLAMALPMHAIKVYYNNPNEWSTVKIYVYSGSNKNAEWSAAPEMTAPATGSNLYSYEVPSGLESGYVLFHNGSGSQYPAQTGEKLEGKSMVCYQDAGNDAKTMWAEYNESACKVYFNNTGNWSTVKVHYFGNTSSEWPGETMTLNGDYYEYTVPAGTCGLVFNDGGSNQTNNLEAKNNYVYSPAGEQGEMGVAQDPFTVYFDNSGKNWSTVCVHAYNDKGYTTTWPGETMVLGEKGLYSFTVDGRTTKVIFNNNNNGEQVGDFAAVANGVYNADGYDCLFSEYTQPGVDPVTAPDHLYVIGTLKDNEWNTSKSVELTKDGDTFTIHNLNVLASSGEKGYITFVTSQGESWNDVNGTDRFGAPTENVPLTSGVASTIRLYATGVDASSAKNWELPFGLYEVVVDFSAMTVKATKIEESVGTGSVTIPTFTIQPGKDANMSIDIDTSEEITAIYFDINLPEKVTPGTPLISRTMANHTLSSNTVGNTIKVAVYSTTNSKFNATNGTLLTVPLSAAPDAVAGNYEVTIQNIVISDANLHKVTPENVTGTMTVSDIEVGSITLNKTVLTLSAGASETLVATVLPDDAHDKTVTWTSSNEDVAVVDANGKVTAKVNGSAVITATCGTLSATCNVYVGKTAQTITWEQTFANIGIGEYTDVFNATASSSLTVSYVIDDGAAYAVIEDNKLKGVAAGVVTVKAIQEGNSVYAPAEPVLRNITVWVGYEMGDVNKDGVVTLADATTVVNKLIGLEPDPYREAAADMNRDNSVDIVDVTLIVEKVVNNTPAAGDPTSAPARVSDEKENFSVVTDEYSMKITFANMQNYVATMFDLILPEGVEVKNIILSGSNHGIDYKEIGDVTRVVSYSDINETYSENGYITIFVNKPINEAVVLNNAVLNRIEGNNIVESPANGCTSVKSGIEAVEDVQAAENVIYNVSGIRVNSDINNLPAGLYIVNGKKIVVR